MNSRSLDKDKMIGYWTISSDEDYDTMLVLYEKRKFNWALFIGHLMIEKLLKALFVKNNNEYPPYIHNLLRLAELCNIQIDDDKRVFFVTVTAFNINARYDDYKLSFQQKCTPEFTRKWIDNILTYRQWIKEQIA